MYNPSTILTNIIDRQLSISHVISDRVFSSSQDASDVITLLSKAAVDLNLSRVVSELGQAEAIGREFHDPLENVPEVQPVFRVKVCVLAREPCSILIFSYVFSSSAEERQQRSR
jgi:DNA-directed RNA polymerase